MLTAAAAVPAVGAAALAVLLSEDAGWPELLFLSVLALTLLAAVRLAGRAGRRAVGERARATRLAGTPVDAVAAAAVAGERSRLAADIHEVVRTAAGRMGDAAETAARRWDDDPTPALLAVQEEGERAGVELRRLLGLLREADAASAAEQLPPAPGPRIARGDVVPAAAVTALAIAEQFAYGAEVRPGVGDDPLSVTLAAAAAATVVLRRPAPAAGAAACGLVFAVSALTRPIASGFWIIATLGVLAWATAAAARPLPGATGLVLLWAGAAAGIGIQDPDNLPFTLVLLGVATAGGAVVRASDAWGRSARARADRRAAELDAAAQAAVRQERLAVARELHDVVSHAIGVMVMQAGAALATRYTDPARAQRALDVVRRTADETSRELARLLAVIDTGALGAPVSTGGEEDALTALVDRMRGGGLAVRLVVEGTPAGEAAPVVYRIVQESLTNVVRHAPGAAVTVLVRAQGAGVTVEVADDGPGPARESRRGYGLVGLAERVHRLGGEFDAGPRPDGTGFRVRAWLPALAASGA